MLYILILIRSVIGAETTLSSVIDFIDFVDKVNSGINYSGTTVYLDSDIVLLESIDHIGNYPKCFLGVFDGQGHIISDLKMNFASQYTGLFGYSKGLTIRNVVLDSSCSITSSFSPSNAYIGGIIGKCDAVNGQCNIENSVNMADVTFSGITSYSVYIGGIVGRLWSSTHNAYVKNCVNYGSVTDSGTVTNWAELSGIVGVSIGNSSAYKYIQNCLNYGIITHNGTSTNLAIGGIVGFSSYTYIENCVSAGKIVTNQESSYTGSLVGNIGSGVHINYCYYTSDVNASGKYGHGKPSSTIRTFNSPTNVNSDLVSKLNSNATSCNWSKWLLNPNNATVTFKMSDDKGLSFSSQIILVQNPAKEGNSFLFWCEDKECTGKFDSETDKINETAELYAAWMNNTVTFDLNGGDDLSEISKIVTFNEEYGPLPEPKKEGYTFIGWFTEDNKNVINKTTVTIPHNHTLYARWEEISEVKKEKSSVSVFVIVGVTVPVVVIIIIAIILVVVFKKKDSNVSDGINDIKDAELDDRPREEYCRIVTTTLEETETKIALENSQGILTNLYPQDYERPSMRDALLEAGLTEEKIDYICSACEIASQKASEKGRLFEDFTEEDAAAIAMYTYDLGLRDFEYNLYRIINRSLVGRNYNSLQKASGLLYLVMSALRKLPRYTGKTLYRGVRGEVNLDMNHYSKGNVITWSALSSTSPSMEATKAFLARGSKSKKVMGTLFIIEGGWGYNIQPYSLFPDEVEILLEPDRQFKVTGVIEADLTIINLQMLDTPLSIPEVFGGK